MGVPAFFKWLSKKYPMIVKDAIEVWVKDVDGHEIPINAGAANPNDMNGIIHPCTHPTDEAAPKDERGMFEAVCDYVDRLFSIVRPRRVLFMAIDGVGPRAKINQQRSRRFRAAKDGAAKATKDREYLTKQAEAGVISWSDVPLSDEDMRSQAFDSNTITPGTPFMDRLAIYLREYVIYKQNTSDAWRNVKVILSDSNVPGEGEHKVMEFIRHQRGQPDYDANTKHVLYGLDADLIMLGLATHELHFTIIREVVTNPRNEQYRCTMCGSSTHNTSECPMRHERDVVVPSTAKKPFQFLRLSVLREYLSEEFKRTFGSSLKFEYDLERMIDDFVFMCFFVGNDFLPHLPSLDIREGSIDDLLDIYKKILPTFDGYITENGTINWDRAGPVLEKVGNMEDAVFQQRRQKLLQEKERDDARRRRENERKRAFEDIDDSRKRARLDDVNKNAAKALRAALNSELLTTAIEDNVADLVDSKPNVDESSPKVEQQEAQPADSVKELATATMTAPPPAGSVVKKEEEEPSELIDDVRLWESGWKDRYYRLKFHAGDDIENVKKSVAVAYREGLQWVLLYYYEGCPSWSWYYPFHYACFASDLTLATDSEMSFTLGSPFTPFQQLMAVLPAKSAAAVPDAYQKLMTEATSEIIDFYPEDFEVDMNGKKFEWMGVALLPFIDEKRLIEATTKLEHTLTPDERRRNSVGIDLLFVHSSNILGAVLSAMSTGTRTVPVDYDKCPTQEDVLKASLEASKNLGVRTFRMNHKKCGLSGHLFLPVPHATTALWRARLDERGIKDITIGKDGFGLCIPRTLNVDDLGSYPTQGQMVPPRGSLAGTRATACPNSVYVAVWVLPGYPKDHVFPASVLPTATPPDKVLSRGEAADYKSGGTHRGEGSSRGYNERDYYSQYAYRDQSDPKQRELARPGRTSSGGGDDYHVNDTQRGMGQHATSHVPYASHYAGYGVADRQRQPGPTVGASQYTSILGIPAGKPLLSTPEEHRPRERESSYPSKRERYDDHDRRNPPPPPPQVQPQVQPQYYAPNYGPSPPPVAQYPAPYYPQTYPMYPQQYAMPSAYPMPGVPQSYPYVAPNYVPQQYQPPAYLPPGMPAYAPPTTYQTAPYAPVSYQPAVYTPPGAVTQAPQAQYDPTQQQQMQQRPPPPPPPGAPSTGYFS